jgi:uncharacterized repeat protein (TIGR03803 family)
MLRASRRSACLTALAVATTGAVRTDQPSQVDPSERGRPTAHYLALHDFGTSFPTKRNEPIWFREPGALVEGPGGDIYSTSPSGGKFGKGVVFKITTKGVPTVLYPFDGGKLGSEPHSGLTDGKDGYYYGTTYGGGNLSVGVIFRIKPTQRKPELLYSFRNGYTRGLVPPCPKPYRCDFSPRQKADAVGSYPISPPMLGPNGTFYGVTSYSGNQQWGTLYSIGPPYDSTGFRTLCIFNPRLLADSTMAGYVCDPKVWLPTTVIVGDGGTMLYGTTASGNGAVFKATLAGKLTLLHQFNLEDGSRPTNLMQASDNKLYGTTMSGGDRGFGVIYRVDPVSGSFDRMSSFRIGKFLAGAVPVAGLTEGKDARGRSDGYLYGTTKSGGAESRGTIYKIRRDGDSLDLHVLHDFSLYATGRYALGPVLPHSDGSLYGFTSQGGLRDAGVFFRLSEQDLPEQPTHAGSFAPARRNPAQVKDQLAVPKGDKLVDVQVHAIGTQPPKSRVPLPHFTDDGIAIRVGCRNPHFVQFIYREHILNGQPVAGFWEPTSGTGKYALTTDPKNPVWHSDGNNKPDAFYEQGKGAGWYRYTSRETTWLTMFDQPNYPGFDQPLTVQQADPTIYRAGFRTFAICNGDVVREIRWTSEAVKGVRSYLNVKILKADNSHLSWINSQLVSDGYRAIP